MGRPKLSKQPILVQARVPPDLIARMDRLASRTGTTRSRIVVDALRRQLEAPAPPAENVFESEEAEQ